MTNLYTAKYVAEFSPHIHVGYCINTFSFEKFNKQVQSIHIKLHADLSKNIINGIIHNDLPGSSYSSVTRQSNNFFVFAYVLFPNIWHIDQYAKYSGINLW